MAATLRVSPLSVIYQQKESQNSLLKKWLEALDKEGIAWEQISESLLWLPEVNMWATLETVNVSVDRLVTLQNLARRTGNACLILIGEPRNRGYYGLLPSAWGSFATEDECKIMYRGVLFNAIDNWPFMGKKYMRDNGFFELHGVSPTFEFPLPLLDSDEIREAQAFLGLR